MCGIFGVVSSSINRNDTPLNQRLAELLSLLKHRGPDSLGYHCQNNWFVGNTRLAIVDVIQGDQPFNFDDEIFIVLNGEIYNHQDMRKQLLSLGYTFKTSSDTEVALMAYVEYGPEFLAKIEGMFAIAVFDLRNHTLLLARDRFGQKPIYYFSSNEEFIFASEVEPIRNFMHFENEIESTIATYLQIRFVPGPNSFIRGIQKLPEGSSLLLNLNSLHQVVQPYYTKSLRSEKATNISKNQVQIFSNLFEESVENCIKSSDFPVGIFLSGGLDSASIAAAAVSRGFQNVQTFTVGFGARDFDEVENSERISNYLGIKQNIINVSPKDFWFHLPNMVAAMDEPIFDLANLPLFLLCSEASKTKKVVLSGEGADEILFGYDFNQLLLKSRVANLLKPLIPKFLTNSLLKPNFIQYLNSNKSDFLEFSKPYISSLFTPSEVANILKFEIESAVINNFYSQFNEVTITEIQNLYRKTWLVDHLLQRTDRISMYHSLEVRLPFLNHHLVEFCDSLPQKELVRPNFANKESKRILRKYALNFLPKELVFQPKRGFIVPKRSWLLHQRGENVREILQSKDSRISEYISSKYIDYLLKSFESDMSNDDKIWSLVFLEIWLEQNA